MVAGGRRCAIRIRSPKTDWNACSSARQNFWQTFAAEQIGQWFSINKKCPFSVLNSAIYPSRVRISEFKTENRSEEHTSELQSRGHLVCRLLLEKKKKKKIQTKHATYY